MTAMAGFNSILSLSKNNSMWQLQDSRTCTQQMATCSGGDATLMLIANHIMHPASKP